MSYGQESLSSSTDPAITSARPAFSCLIYERLIRRQPANGSGPGAMVVASEKFVGIRESTASIILAVPRGLTPLALYAAAAMTQRQT